MSLNEWSPATATELADLVAENFHRDRRPLIPAGGGTALHFGGPMREGSTFVRLTELNRVLDYPARDMTITVEAGMRVDDLQRRLASERQTLPVDIAQSRQATIGGALATNTSGPRRHGHGTLRDYVIGISGVDGQGRQFSAGGRVVKNVAGYDLCKLLVGSLGTLAVITQVTLKLRPLPETRGCLWGAYADPRDLEAAMAGLNLSETRPVILDVLNPRAISRIQGNSGLQVPGELWGLCVGFEGSPRETNWQLETVAAELRACSTGEFHIVADDAERRFSSLTEFSIPSGDALTVMATLPPSHTIEFITLANELGLSMQAHAGNGIVMGHLEDGCSDATSAKKIVNPLREFACRHAGALTILKCDDAWKVELNVFGPATPAWTIMRGLKQSLDPAGVLNPGRML